MLKSKLYRSTILATGFGLAMALGAGGASAGVILTGSVTPSVGPGDTTVSGGVTVGDSAAGTLDINGGNVLTVNEIVTPTSTFDGARVHVGNGGTGDLTIDGGALNINAAAGRLDGARLQVSNVPGINAPSATGDVTMQNGAVLNIDGVESAGISIGRDGLGNMLVDGSSIDIDATNGSASISIGSGSSVSPLQPDSEGHLTLTNASQLNLTSASSGGFSIITVGRRPNSTGPLVDNTLDINGGTNVVIDNTGGGESLINIARDGANGAVVVSGTGTTVDINNTSGGISALQVGRSGAGTGMATVSNGAAVTVGDYVSIGRDGATGALDVAAGGTVDNTGGIGLTRLGRTGGDGALNASSGGVYSTNNLNVGHDSGSTGTLDATTGGTVNVTDTFIVGRSGTGTADFSFTGTLNAHTAIVGLNSNSSGIMNVTSTTLNLAGLAPNFADPSKQDGAALVVGSRGTGTLDLNFGGTIVIAPGTPVNGGLSGGLLIGGSATNPTGTGDGTVNVNGGGSSIILSSVNGQAGFTQVGRDGTGVLNILNGGLVDGATQTVSSIGRKVGGDGTVNVTGTGSVWNAGDKLFVGTDVNLGTGAVSGAGGDGILNVANGGSVNAGSVYLGATGTLTGGGGTITGDITNDGGTIAAGNSPGLMTVMGNVALLGGSTMEIELAGTVFDSGIPQFDYDRLDVSDNLATTGTTEGDVTIDAGAIFDIDFFGAFTAVLGDTFDVIVADDIISVSLTSLIFDFTGAALATGLDWDIGIVSFGSGREALQLTVVAEQTAVSEPSIIIVFGLGIAGLMFARRKRAA
jgi:T5SS/PEP-CTERM-associated repeat protein